MLRQVELLRDLVGNPFRRVRLNLSWLAWNDGAIPKMAQSIYDARAFDRLPLLADALEDAGCDDADILSHCRTPGEHVRGCWVVDLLLGKIVNEPRGRGRITTGGESCEPFKCAARPGRTACCT